MIRKSIKIAIRRLITQQSISLINITGMAVAVSVSLAILLYVSHHYSFDKHVPNSENAYRIISHYGEGTFSINTFAGFDDVLDEFPEVESHTICYIIHNVEDVFVGENEFEVKDALITNESFLDFFDVHMIRGEKSSINEPNTMLVTPAMAEKLFPDQDAVGQLVSLRSFSRNQDSLISYLITGIIEPLPENSHIKYEILLSQEGHFTPTTNALKSRKVFGGLIYVKLHPSASIQSLEKNLQTVLEPVLGGKHGPPLEAINHKLQALHDIHTSQEMLYEMQPTVSRSSLNILFLVGLLIFVIAIMNSVIMHITRNSFNQTATMIIRFHGGDKTNLFVQSLIDVFISAVISFTLALFLLSFFNLLVAEQFFTDWYISFDNLNFWAVFFALFLLVITLISVLSSLHLFQKLPVLKDANKNSAMKAAVPLVIFQFAMVVGLIGFALMLNKQMQFVDSKELGYDSENIIAIKVPQQNEKVDVFCEELLNIPGIIHAGTARHYPGYRLQDMNFTSGSHVFPFKFGHIDHEAIETLDIQPLWYYDEAESEAKGGWLINETFYDHLSSIYSEEQIASGDFPTSEGDETGDNRDDFEIIGVIKDFHYASLHSEIENFAFFIPDAESRVIRFVLARIRQNEGAQVISEIENLLSEFYPGHPVNYSFLDEELNREYASEQLLMRLINAFSLLSILIASMGLLGLSIFITEKRTKEIGIRKVNGASVFEIVKMLNIVFVRWVVLAFIVATPFSYYFSQRWLHNFAYSTQPSWWIFFLAGVITLFIVIIAVSWQTIKVARRNPVQALRYE